MSHKYLEKIVIKEDIKCLEVEPLCEIDGYFIFFNVVNSSTDIKHSLLSICTSHLL
jgi:hypothetical protein